MSTLPALSSATPRPLAIASKVSSPSVTVPPIRGGRAAAGVEGEAGSPSAGQRAQDR
jgi:hypothetical protein